MREQLPLKYVVPETEFPEALHDYFTIYDDLGQVLIRSKPYGADYPITLEYERLSFTASKGYGTSIITVEFYGLTEAMNQDADYEAYLMARCCT